MQKSLSLNNETANQEVISYETDIQRFTIYVFAVLPLFRNGVRGSGKRYIGI